MKWDTVIDTLKITDNFGLRDISDSYNYELWVQSLFFIVKLAQEGLMIALLYNVCLIFKNTSIDGIPFKMKIAHQIRTVAVISLIYSLIPAMTFDTSELTSDFVSGDQGIIIAVIFLGIAKVFEYGCILQQESDETL